jgi:MOSC domain-containing protein YiiM
VTRARPHIAALARSTEHRFSKSAVGTLMLIAGSGVANDAHAGSTVQHLSRVRTDPSQPNLRQVHLIHGELLDDVAAKGFFVAPGDLGENILTRGIDLLTLPENTLLTIGEAALRITGLRNPCAQIDRFMQGLLAEMIEKRADGTIARKCGVMAVVERGGAITAGDEIVVSLPTTPHRALGPV